MLQKDAWFTVPLERADLEEENSKGGGDPLGSCTATSRANFGVISPRDTAPAATSMYGAQNGRVHALLVWLHEAQARGPGTEHRQRGAALTAYADPQNCGAPHHFIHDR